MPIKVRISRGYISDRPEDRADLNWKESYPKALDRWLSQYTGWYDDPDHFDDAVRYRRCPHGCLVATDTESGGEANYCTICCPAYVPTPPRLEPYPLPSGHPWRLRFFQRKGFFDLTKRGTVGRHYYPGDHEVCPYNPSFRMRAPESMGGYHRSGQKDGNGIKAVLGNGPTNDDFEMRWAEFYGPDGFVDEWHPGSYATAPAPDSECEWIDDHLFRTSRATRLVPELGTKPESICLDFADDRGRDDHWWHPDKKFIIWRKPLWAFSPWVWRPAPTPPDTDVFSYWANRHCLLQPRVLMFWKWPPQHMDFLSCLMCLKHWATDREIETWQRKYWHGKTKYAGLTVEERRELPSGRNRRKTWPEKWRSERKMQKLDTRLGLENHGWEPEANLPKHIIPPRYNVHRMVRRTVANFRKAHDDLAEVYNRTSAKQTFWPAAEGSATWPSEAKQGMLCYEGEQASAFDTSPPRPRPKLDLYRRNDPAVPRLLRWPKPRVEGIEVKKPTPRFYGPPLPKCDCDQCRGGD